MQNQINEEKKVNPALPWIVWGALLGSILVYGVTSFFIINNPNPDMVVMDPEMMTTMTYAFGALSLLAFPMALFFRKSLFTKRIEQGEFEDVEELRAGVFTPYITSWTLSESVAIYGFLLTFLSSNMNYYFGFASLSLLYMVIFRPNFAAVKEIYYREYPDRRHL